MQILLLIKMRSHKSSYSSRLSWTWNVYKEERRTVQISARVNEQILGIANAPKLPSCNRRVSKLIVSMKTYNIGTLTLMKTLTASSPLTLIRWLKVINPWSKTLAATNYYPTFINHPSSICWMLMAVLAPINKRVLSDKSYILYRKIRPNTPRIIIKIRICSLRIRNSKVACR